MAQISGENSKLFGVCVQGQRQKYTPPSPPLSKVEELRDIRYSMSIGNLILWANSVTVSYLIHYYSLLQNVADIIAKCDSCIITKCEISLLQNASSFLSQHTTILLQNATVTKWDVFYKLPICDSALSNSFLFCKIDLI